MRGIRALREHEMVQAPAEPVHAPMPPVPPRRKKLVQQAGLANGQFSEGESSSTHNSGWEIATSCGSAEDDDLDFEVGRIVAKGVEEERGCVFHNESST